MSAFLSLIAGTLTTLFSLGFLHRFPSSISQPFNTTYLQHLALHCKRDADEMAGTHFFFGQWHLTPLPSPPLPHTFFAVAGLAAELVAASDMLISWLLMDVKKDVAADEGDLGGSFLPGPAAAGDAAEEGSGRRSGLSGAPPKEQHQARGRTRVALPPRLRWPRGPCCAASATI